MRTHKTILLVIAAIMLPLGVSNAQVKQKISEEELTALLGRVDASAARFAKTADKAMDKAGFDGSAREDELNRILTSLTTATAALASDHSAANSKNNFEIVLDRGVAIENFLKRNPLDGVEDDWKTLRADLGELAAGFNITWEQGHAITAPVGEADIKNLFQHLEDKADKYKLSLDAALDNSALNNTAAEGEINRVNADFRKATRRLEDHRKDNSAAEYAKEVLTQGKRINTFLEKHSEKLTPEVKGAWGEVRTDLDRLLRFYNVQATW